MEKREFIYEGKAKQIYTTDDENLIIMHYKDDATAFDGTKKASITSKGILNNYISEIILTLLKDNGIPTHFIKRLDDRDQLCQKVKIIPLEVIIRNIIAGSMAKRLDIEEGTIPKNTIFEICFKEDKLHDPMINEHHAVALGICTYEEYQIIYQYTIKINEILKKFFLDRKIVLVDFKIEFGKNNQGEIILADEMSPDSCRLWDLDTKQKLDKDRFRRDLGGVIEAYQEIYQRVSK